MGEDAFIATAAAVNDRKIVVAVCLDPVPPSGKLAAGEYRAEVEFTDPRIPETTLTFDVWVGGAARVRYAIVVAVVGALLLSVLPVAIAFVASVIKPDWRAALAGTIPWLVPLLVLVAIGYFWAVVTFPISNRYHLWSPTIDGAREFLHFTSGKVTLIVSAAMTLLVALPKWRDASYKLFGPTTMATAGANPTPAPPPAPDPRRARGGTMWGRHRRWPSVAAAYAGVLVVYFVAAFASAGEGASEQSAFEPTTDDDDECGVNFDCADEPPEEAFGGLAVGDTPGDEAVEDLRGVGFVVSDYFVCSGTSEQGLLGQVRETGSGGVVVGSDGLTELATAVEPPDALDVLITSGEACNG